MGGSPGRNLLCRSEVEVADLLVERLDIDLEDAGGPRLVPAGRVQHTLDVAALDVGQWHERVVGFRRRGRRGRERGPAKLAGQVGCAYLMALMEDLQALDQVAQLADIAGPIVVHQAGHRV